MESSIELSTIEPQFTKISDNKWSVTVEEDPTSNDLIVPLPSELLANLGWDINDVIVWNIDKATGVCTLSKKVSE